MDIDFIERLERKLTDDLPGLPAQLLMAPKGREEYLKPSVSYREAAVLALIFPKQSDWFLTLIERTTANPNDPHSGQISLPGGKLEEEDASYAECALRETQEEIGIMSDEIAMLGELSTLYLHVSDFMIYPFVGFMSKEPDFEPNAHEVTSVIEVPLDVLVEAKYKKSMDINVRDILLKDTPVYKYENHQIWGATAMILSELGEILKEVY